MAAPFRQIHPFWPKTARSAVPCASVLFHSVARTVFQRTFPYLVLTNTDWIRRFTGSSAEIPSMPRTVSTPGSSPGRVCP